MRMALTFAAIVMPAILDAALDTERFLMAISAVESGHNDYAVNPRSQASSRYQITRTVWRQWQPKTPFSMCRGELAHSVATRHVEWLAAHIGTDPAALAAAWRWGLRGSQRDAWNSDYPIRVRNLYHALARRET